MKGLKTPSDCASGVILSRSSCKQALKCAEVKGLCCAFYILKCGILYILKWEQVGTTGRRVQHQHPLLTQPCHCNASRMKFCIVLLKYARVSLEKICFSKITDHRCLSAQISCRDFWRLLT